MAASSDDVLLPIPDDTTDGLGMEQQQQADDVISIQLSVDPMTTDPGGLSPPRPHITAAQQKAMFKLGFLIVLVTIYGASNPPIPDMAMTNKVHRVLSLAYSVAVYASLAVGALQLVLATLAPRAPQLIYAANTATEVGLVLARVMLGFGASLVLLVEASPWFVLYVIFLSITFFM